MAINSLVRIYLTWIFAQIPITAGLFGWDLEFGSTAFAAVDVAVSLLLLSGSGARHLGGILQTMFRMRPFLFYILWSCAALIWSISATPSFDVGLILRDLLRVFICIYIARRLAPGEVLRAVTTAAIGAAMIYGVIAVIVLRPSEDVLGGGSRYQFVGYKDSVGVGKQAAFLALLCACAWFIALQRRATALFGAVIATAVLLLAFAKTALFALLLSFAFFLRRHLTSRTAFFALVALVLMAWGIVEFRGDYIFAYVNSGDEFSASGRLIIWEQLATRAPDRLLLGYGIDPVFTLLDGYFYKTPGTSHNDVLQQLISLGIPGVLLWIWLQFDLFLAAKSAQVVGMARLTRAVTIFFLILGVTESNLVFTTFPIYLIALFRASLFVEGDLVRHSRRTRRYQVG